MCAVPRMNRKGNERARNRVDVKENMSGRVDRIVLMCFRLLEILNWERLASRVYELDVDGGLNEQSRLCLRGLA